MINAEEEKNILKATELATQHSMTNKRKKQVRFYSVQCHSV